MRKLRFWIDVVEGINHNFNAWHCSDGVSTYFGETRSEAAAHFGVPVGDYDDETDRAELGKNNRYER